jgi:hypothetical protein
MGIEQGQRLKKKRKPDIFFNNDEINILSVVTALIIQTFNLVDEWHKDIFIHLD